MSTPQMILMGSQPARPLWHSWQKTGVSPSHICGIQVPQSLPASLSHTLSLHQKGHFASHRDPRLLRLSSQLHEQRSRPGHLLHARLRELSSRCSLLQPGRGSLDTTIVMQAADSDALLLGSDSERQLLPPVLLNWWQCP